MNLESLYDQYIKLEQKKNIDGNSKEALEAVTKDGYILKYIHNPSEQVCLAAVEQEGMALRYISNPSEEVCLAAVKQDRNALQYIPQYIFDNMISKLPKELKLTSPSAEIRKIID